MSTKRINGNAPLDEPSINALKIGVNAAFSQLEGEVGERTPMPSMHMGSIQLHNQTILVPKKARRQSTSHPWKVTGDGAENINVGRGSVYSWDEESITLREYKYFEGMIEEEYTPIEVTGSGSIYGAISSSLALNADIQFSGTDSAGDTFDVYLNRVFPDDTASFSFSFETTPPSNSSTFYFELAKVDLVDGVAVVTRQITIDNPTLSSWLEAP